ncbi:hypothetical protein GCM10011517_31450 [Actibacterium pelagium]|uniref:Uncharacterized protein n=1 Tax=Actibacterium pelagium TaxID=2029103 RepID=A0A917EMJ4_9RHOB|nr:hypothetical protein GCM10011517_31450 [Actibacterium pelagium]
MRFYARNAQLNAMIARGKPDALIYLIDPMTVMPHARCEREIPAALGDPQ